MPGGKFSGEEVERIFAAAARRQQQEKQNADNYLSLEELEAAGREAGIDPRHVRAAAAEVLRPSRAPQHKSFLGLPVELRDSRVIDASAEAIDWRSVVLQLRKLFGKPGVTTDLGSVREWASDAAEGNMPTRVVIEPEGDQTRVTVERKTWPTVAGTLSGVASLFAAALIIIGLWVAGGAASNVWIPAAVLSVSAAAFGAILYTLIRRDGRKTLDRFQEAIGVIERSSNQDDRMKPATSDHLVVREGTFDSSQTLDTGCTHTSASDQDESSHVNTNRGRRRER